MNVNEIYRTDVITISKDASINDAARYMKLQCVGSLVVTESDNKTPVGMITDRDITIKVVAEGKSTEQTKVSEIMSQELLVLHENEDMIDIIDAFCDKGVRRAPVIDKNNQICGIIAADDLLSVIADELSGVADLVKLQSSTQENVSEKEKQTKLSGIIHDRSQLGDRAQTGGRRIWGQVGDRYNVHPDDASAGPQSNAKLDIRAPQLPIENIDSNVHDQPPKVDTAKDLNITNIGGTKKNSSKK